MRLHRGRFAAAAVALTAVLLAGCSSGGHPAAVASLAGTSGPSGTTARHGPLTQAQRNALAVDFARCMRSHGVDMPDPQPTGRGGLSMDGPVNQNQAVLRPAQQACEPLIQPIVNEKMASANSPENLARLLQFVRCIRQHGVPDMPDPTAQGAISFPQGSDKTSPQMRQAVQACDHLLKGQSRPGAGTPSGPPKG
jgi:hypothetical protein